MRIVKELNGWTIKKKKVTEIPTWAEVERPYAIFSPTGLFMEDNLTWLDALDWCRKHLDYVESKNGEHRRE